MAHARSAEDADTCRICRGEGSSAEPLFHPCKCSGSIMYVHQECLMTWLSHSQKKHCELCKTNFRFTKLYSPHMPEHLPIRIFFQRAAMHTLGSLLYWLRALFVAATWLIWLPWSMRFVWWALLWIADGGWVGDALGRNPISRSHWTPSSATPITLSVFHAFNITIDPVPRGHSLARRLWSILNGNTSSTDSPSQLATSLTTTNTTNSPNIFEPRGSLLSDVHYLKNLTPYPSFNSFVIDVVEGQIITFSILIAVVLVFLIREWVVQQQPPVNWAAANDAPRVADDGAARDDGNDDAIEPAEDPTLNQFEDVAQGQAEDTNSDHIDPPPSPFADQTDLLPEGVELDPPLFLASEQAVNDVLHHLETYQPEIAQLSVPSEVPIGASRPRKIAQDLIAHLYATHIAISKASRLAFQASDVGELAELRERMARLEAGLHHLGDLPERAQLSASIGSMRSWVERVLAQQLTPGMLSAGDSGGEQLASASDLLTAQIDAAAAADPTSLRHQDHVAGADDHSAPSRSRPTMPVRDASFLATEIQRGLEESSSTSALPSTSDSSHEGQHATPSSSRKGNASDRSASTESFSLLDADSAGPGPAMRTETGTFDLEDLPSTLPRPSGLESEASSSSSSSSEQSISSGSEQHTPDDEGVANNGQDFLQDPNDNVEVDAPASNDVVPIDDTPKSIYGRVGDWMWGALPEVAPDDTAQNGDDAAQEIADEPELQFEMVADEVPDDQGGHDVGDPNQENLHPAQDFGGAILEAQNDAEIAGEDIEDLEGLMELIGMQGNILGLFQNAVFMAVVGSAAITTAVWFPYLWGKLVLVFVANPLQVAIRIPLEILSGFANFAIDICIWFCGSILAWVDASIQLVWRSALWLTASTHTSHGSVLGRYTQNASEEALARIVKHFMGPADYMHLSASSHASLRTLQSAFSHVSNTTKAVCLYVYRHSSTDTLDLAESLHYLADVTQTAAVASASSARAVFNGISWPTNLTWANAMTVQIKSASSLTPLDPSLAVWSGTDRALAVLAGYGFFIVLGAIYLTRLAPLATTRQAKKVEDNVIDVLQQAGGIMKVIIIISIEMLLFPVYCGALLDIATLPLFDGHTVEDRLMFTINSPWISAYTHWFIGTCYMFHLALFVSMCRKILRPGTIYFIRDPDDPTFHPVRDVLERNLASQMRKIVASATVYGGLVILLMGGVVWTLSLTNTGILPIRWSSSDNVKGFPIDLLIYTTLKPIVIKLWSPSSGIHTLYAWSFRHFAAYLRLRHFLLNGDVSADRRINHPSPSVRENAGGRFVRAPNSDQARIPRGSSVFVEVDGQNNRVDGKEDDADGPHGLRNLNFTTVYVPPYFRARIMLFIACLYMLTAAVGLGLTVIPLLTGRLVFSFILPKGSHVTDIYAFVLGLCPVAATLYMEGVHAFRLAKQHGHAGRFLAGGVGARKRDRPQSDRSRVGVAHDALAQLVEAMLDVHALEAVAE
ncbi:hypothetical protein FH972_025637 [Carpinus fangiana]|uniref:RING-type E3 ubiquitin transferase n=1 Tax=Carpinus fangiana TaxID=176857 RepID=A0A5N6L1V3_9ROSI|nr:hypothetical protein FH972_025637 [Carpinus fangiana]